MKFVFALALVLLSGCATAAPAPSAAPRATCASATVTSPLEGASVHAVRPLVAKVESENKKVAFTRVLGAEIVLSATADTTAEELEGRARCALERRAAAPHDPLAVAGAEVRVRRVGAGLALQITSTDPDVARDILARAERLPRQPG